MSTYRTASHTAHTRGWPAPLRQLALATTIAGCGTAFNAPAASAAQLVDHSHQYIVASFDVQTCGLDLSSTVNVVVNNQERIASSGFPLFKGTSSGTQTYTNPQNHKTLTISFAGRSQDMSVTDNGDGTITLVTANTGMPEKLRLPDGTIVSMDVGRIVFTTVIDYNDTPLDTSDDIFVSQLVSAESGPHPDFDSDFAQMCNAFTTYLS